MVNCTLFISVSCPDGEFKSANMIKCAECASVYHIPTPDKTSCGMYLSSPKYREIDSFISRYTLSVEKIPVVLRPVI